MPYKDPQKQKEVQAAYYQKNKEKCRKLHRDYRHKIANMINEAKNTPCADCDVLYPPYVMDFDHKDPLEKSFNISRATRTHSIPKLLEEIAKCEVVCSNCHRIRTFKSGIYDHSVV